MKVRVLVAVCCFILGIIASATLQTYAAVIAIVALILIAIGWSARSITIQRKLVFAISSLALVVIVNGAEVWRREAAEAEHEKARVAADERKTAEDLNAVQEAQNAFKKMTPQEHLAVAKRDLRTDLDQIQIDEGIKSLEALKGTPLEKQGDLLRAHYQAKKSQEEKLKSAEQAKEAARQARETAASQELVRIAYAKFMEDSLLRNNFNVDINAYGPQHKYLRLKWVLASKAMVFNFTEQRQDMLGQMRQDGFTKFTITDGYDESWTWDLSK